MNLNIIYCFHNDKEIPCHLTCKYNIQISKKKYFLLFQMQIL